VCSPSQAFGFEGVVGPEAVTLSPTREPTAQPGQISVNVRPCGGPLTFALTLAFDGEREGETLNVLANATDDCLIQAFYGTLGDAEVAATIDINLAGWRGSDSILVEGSLVAESRVDGAAPRVEGSFSVRTVFPICL
jgi:hypothetical protein